MLVGGGFQLCQRLPLVIDHERRLPRGAAMAHELFCINDVGPCAIKQGAHAVPGGLELEPLGEPPSRLDGEGGPFRSGAVKVC